MKRYKPITDFSYEGFKKINKEAKLIRSREANAPVVEDYEDFLKKYDWAVKYGGLDVSDAIEELNKLRYGLIDSKGLIDHRHIISLFKLTTTGFTSPGFTVGDQIFKGAYAINVANTIAYYRSKWEEDRGKDRAVEVNEMRSYLQMHIPQMLYYKNGDVEESILYRRFYDDIAYCMDVQAFKDAIDTFLKTGDWNVKGKAGSDLFTYQNYPEYYKKEVDTFEKSIGVDSDSIDEEDYVDDDNTISEEDYTAMDIKFKKI